MCRRFGINWRHQPPFDYVNEQQLLTMNQRNLGAICGRLMEFSPLLWCHIKVLVLEVSKACGSAIVKGRKVEPGHGSFISLSNLYSQDLLLARQQIKVILKIRFISVYVYKIQCLCSCNMLLIFFFPILTLFSHFHSELQSLKLEM